jgi:hypothetical protein
MSDETNDETTPEPEPERDDTQPEPEPADEPEDDEQDDEQEAPPSPPDAGPSPAEMEARFKKAETAFKTYTNRLGTIFEEQANELLECPLCSGDLPGFVFPGGAGHVAPEVERAVKLYLGYATAVDYAASQSHRACAICDGQGKVRTGSKVAQWETLTCPTCKGYGFVPPPGEHANGAGPAEHVPAGMVTPPIDFEQAGVDPSGEPRLLPDGRENPNYGKWPQFKVAVPPWGVTAGLTAQQAV